MSFICPYCCNESFRLLAEAGGKTMAECLSCGKTVAVTEAIVPSFLASPTMAPAAPRRGGR